jgi:hypothetical protein
MIRRNLLAWQWSDYAAKHRDRENLLIHLVAVPLFQAGTVILVVGIGIRSALGIGIALACLAVALVTEGRGARAGGRDTGAVRWAARLCEPLRRGAVDHLSPLRPDWSVAAQLQGGGRRTVVRSAWALALPGA